MMFLEAITSLQTWAMLFVLLVGAVASGVAVCEIGNRLENLKRTNRKDHGEADD